MKVAEENEWVKANKQRGTEKHIPRLEVQECSDHKNPRRIGYRGRLKKRKNKVL